MHSRQQLGAFALAAIAVAAISFAVVDATIAAANGCLGHASECATSAVPVTAFSFAALGALALLVGIVPSVGWIMATIERREAAADGDGDGSGARHPELHDDPTDARELVGRRSRGGRDDEL